MRKDSLSYIALIVFFLGTFSSHGQGNQEKELLKEVLETLSERYQVQFNYQSDILDNIFVDGLPPNTSLEEHFQAYQIQTGLRFVVI